MRVSAFSLKGPKLTKEAVSVSVKTPNGEITILDNHRPLITLLAKGVLRIIDRQGKSEEIEVEGGFIEVLPKSDVNILVN